MVDAPTPHLGAAAQRLLPGLRVLSSSAPDPLLRRHNVLLLQADLDAARQLVVEIEDQLGSGEVAFVALGREPVADAPGAAANAVDERGGAGADLVSWWGRSLVLGAAAGALLGAVIFAAVGYALGVRGGLLVGGTIGVGLLVGVFMAIWTAFARMGGSDAFRQTFIPHEANDVAVVAVLTDDPDERAMLRRRGEELGVTVVELDAYGRVIDPAPRPRR